MKTTIKEYIKTIPDITYPCLMKFKNSYATFIVYANKSGEYNTKQFCGTVIYLTGTTSRDIGEYDDEWELDQFTVFDGILELSND